MKPSNEEINYYATMGKAALLPGMMKMLDLMQRQIDEFRRELAGAQIEPKRLGRPRKEAPATLSGRGLSGWSADPEERKKEMARRQAVARAKANGKKLHPRDAGHPGHEAWKDKMRKVQRARWKKMTPAQRKGTLAKMLGGQERSKPEVKLAVAS